MKRILFTALLFLSTQLLAQEEKLNLEGGLNIWSQALSGYVEFEGDRAHVENDLGITDEDVSEAVTLYFESKDILPFLPDIRVFYNYFQFHGTHPENFTFGNITFHKGSDFNVDSQTLGVLFFYSLDLDFATIDFGIDIRKSAFDITVSGLNARAKPPTSVTFSTTQEFGSIVPLGYGKVQFGIPFTGVLGYVELHLSQFFGNTIVDALGGLGYHLPLGFGIEAGFRRTDYFHANASKDIDINLTVQGSFVSIFYLF